MKNNHNWVRHQDGSPASVFPNPLCIQFGEGRILMHLFKDSDGTNSGVMLRDSGVVHAVGEEANLPPEHNTKPQPGEVYLRFSNIESAKALRLTLDEAIAEMTPAAAIAPNSHETPPEADLGPWFKVQGLCTLTQVMDYILTMQREATAWANQVSKLQREITVLRAEVANADLNGGIPCAPNSCSTGG